MSPPFLEKSLCINRSIGRGDCTDFNEDDMVTTGNATTASAANVADSSCPNATAASGANRDAKGNRKRARVRWKEFCAKKVGDLMA